MNRSKRNISRSSRSRNWTDGEEFNFKDSPSPKKKNLRRETSATSRKIAKKDSPQAATDRRKSIYLKRLEIDAKVDDLTVNTRRTRRQSLASLPKAESKKTKTQIPRAKSEKTIPTRSVSKPRATSSTRIGKLKDAASSSSKEVVKKVIAVKKTDSTLKEDKIIVDKSKKSSVTDKKVIDNKQKTLSTSISKDNFYSKSPQRTRPTVRRTSMVKMDSLKMSPVKQDKKSTSSNTKIEVKKPSPVMRKKTQSPHLKKPLKRLSVSTPSPRQDRSRRLTRSSVKKIEKKVQIFAKSPAVNADFRKTPKVYINSVTKMSETETPIRLINRIPVLKLKPFTPKPDEPLKILKQNLKKNVAAEIKNVTKVAAEIKNVTKGDVFKPTSILTVRTPTKSDYSPPKKRTPAKITINGRTPTKNGLHQDSSLSYHMPVTPLSSRKSTTSFRRFRGSVRLANTAEDTLDDHAKNVSIDELMSSTPVKRKERVSFRDEHNNDEELMDISEFSTSAEESKYATSFHDQSFGFNGHSVEEFKETSSEKSPIVEQPTKKSYCSLM